MDPGTSQLKAVTAQVQLSFLYEAAKDKVFKVALRIYT